MVVVCFGSSVGNGFHITLESRDVLVVAAGQVGGSLYIPRTPLSVPAVGVVVSVIMADVAGTMTSKVAAAPGVSGSDYFPFLQVTPLSLFSELLHLITLMWCKVCTRSDAVSEHVLPGEAIFHY